MKRKIILVIVAAISTYLFWVLINRYIFKPKAVSSSVNISFSPAAGTVAIGESKIINVVLQTADTNAKISAFDITFVTIGPIELVNIGSANVLTDLIKTQQRFAAVSTLSDVQLPSSVTIPLTIRASASGPVGQGAVSVDISKSQIVGTIPEQVYSFGSVGQGAYSVVLPTPTPTSVPPTPTSTQLPTVPLPTPTSTLVPQPCPLHSKGDANCDENVDLGDFELWRREYRGELTTKSADFNADGKVDLTDFETWRRSFTSGITGKCRWCGTQCVPDDPNIYCPQVLPPAGAICLEQLVNGQTRCDTVLP